MGWFNRKKQPEARPETKEEIWVQCPSCKAHIYKEEWERELKVCDHCGFHDRITSRERIDLLIDKGSWQELATRVRPADPLKFVDGKGPYADKLEESRKKTGLNEAVVVGRGRMNGMRVALAVMDFRFLGGSLGSGTGEKILQAAEYALSHRIPYIIVSASGGARMHEGIISLMQMAKTCAVLARLHARGVPYISVLTDPTTGGVSASYAMVGDIHISEPGALIGFAGRRVIEETIKQKLPDNFQTAGHVLDHGFLDMIVARKHLKDTIHNILKYATRA